MIIGIPKEIKTDEKRVSITPDKIKGLIDSGHQIVLERGAGESAGFPDSSYQNVEIVNTAQKVWESADLVVKVKEPQKEEFKYFRQNQIIFTYLHLAAVPDLTLELVKKNVTGIAYETIQNNNGSLPLLEPMSEIAGRLSPQIAARVLQSDFNGPGNNYSIGVEMCEHRGNSRQRTLERTAKLCASLISLVIAILRVCRSGNFSSFLILCTKRTFNCRP